MATVQGALREMTARTEAVMADPEATPLDRYLAAVAEEGAYEQIEPSACDQRDIVPADRCAIDYTPEIEAEAAEGPDLEAAI